MSQQAKPAKSGGRSRRAKLFRVGCWVGLGLLALLVVVLLLPRAPQHRLIRSQLYRYLTEQTGREVEVGQVHGSLLGGVTVDGLRIAESEGFDAAGSIVDVKSIELHWNFLKLLFSLTDPMAAISSIKVVEPDVKLRRTTEGVWEIAELLQPDEPKPEKPFTFAGTVRIENGRLLVVDETFPGPAPALERVIEPVNAFLDFDGHGVASFEAAVASEGLVRQLTVDRGRLQLDPLQISGDLAATDLAVTGLAEVVNPFIDQWAQLVGGMLPSLSGRVDVAVTDPEELEEGGLPFDLGLDLTAQANDVAVAVEALGKPIQALTGQLGFTMVRRSEGGPSDQDRIRLESVSAMLGASRVRLNGQIIGFRSDRRYELTVASDQLMVGEVPELLPQIGALAPLRAEGASAAELRLLGALEDLRVEGWVEPNNVAWGDLGKIFSGRVRLDLQRVPPDKGVGGLTGQVEFLRVAAGTKYLGDTLSQLTGGLQLGDDTIAFRELKMLAGDAPLRVDGRITNLTTPAARTFALTVATENLNPTILAPVMPAALRPSESRGGITGRVSLAGPQNALVAAGELRLPWFRTPDLTHLGGRYAFDVRLGAQPTGRIRIADAGVLVNAIGGPIENLDGTVVLRPETAVIQDLRGRFAGGPVRADGTVALDGETFDLALSARGVRLEQLDNLLRPRGIRGRGPLTADLRLRGGLERFTVTGSASVPYLAVPGTVIEGADIVADLGIRPSEGLFGLTGTARLGRTRVTTDAVDAPIVISEGRFRFDSGRIAVTPVRGAINGDPFTARGTLRFARGRTTQLASLDLDVVADRLRGETIRRVAGDLDALDTIRIAEPLSLDVHLSGPPNRLAITGMVDARRVVVTGDNPITIAGRAGLDLRLRPGDTPVGTVDLRGLDADLSNFDLPIRDVTGLLRFASDGRIHLGRTGGLGLRGRAGETEFALRGSVRPGDPVQLDLGVTLQDLQLADVRTALGGMENPPEIEGEGGLGRVQLRVVGTPNRLRVATVGDSGLLGGPMTLPERLTVAGYRLEGGEAAFDILLADGSLAEGSIDLEGVDLTVLETGTLVALDTGRLELQDGQLELADLRATVGGSPVRVAGGMTGEDGELALRLAATEVPILDLMPDAAGLRETLESDLISTDLSVTGPLEDLAIAGTVALGGAPGTEPLTAEVHLRVVEPLDAPGEADDEFGRQILGGVRLTGGEVKLAALDEPIRDIMGEASFSASDIVLEGIEATVQDSRIIANGSIYGLPEPVFDLRVDLPGTDLGELLHALRTPPADDPEGEPVDFFTARGLPRLYTPEPVSGSITVTGPQEQVSIGLDLHLPVLTVDAAAAMPDERGLGIDTPPGANPVLLRDAEITGSVVGSLATGELPEGEEMARALNALAGMELIPVQEGAPVLQPVQEEVAPEGSILDSFVFGIHLRSERIHPRQGFSFMSPEAKEGILGTAYAFQPGSAELDILGPIESLQLKGGFDLPRLEIHGVPVRRLAARFDYFNNVMTLDDILLDIRGGQVTGHGALALVADQPVDLELELAVDSLELAVLNTLPEAEERDLEFDGVLDGAVQVHLSEETPRVSGAMNLDSLSINQEMIGDGEVDFGFEKDLLVLRRLQLSEPVSGAYAQAKGRVALSEDGPIDLVADVRNFDLGRIAPLLSPGPDPDQPVISGRLDLVAAVAGTRQVPLITGAANIFFGSIAGYPFHRLSVRSTETEPGSLRITGELSDAAYRGDAVALLENIDFTSGEMNYTVDLDLASVDLEQTLPLATAAGLEETFGEVQGTAHLTGRVERQVAADGSTRLNPLVDLVGHVKLAAGDAEQPARLQIAGLQLDTARLELDAHDDMIVVEALEVTRADTRIGIAPEQVNRITNLSDEPRIELHLVSDELHYEDLVSLTRLPLQTEGYLMVSADIAGPLRDPVVDARIRSEDFVLNGEEIGDRVIHARIAKGLAAIDGPQTFELFGTRLTIGGQIDQDRINASVDLEIEDFEELRTFLLSLTQPVGERRRLPWQQRLRNTLASVPGPLAGDFSARLSLAGPRDNPTGYLAATGRGLHAGERPIPPVEVMVNVGRGAPAEPSTFEPGIVYLFGAVDLGGELRLQARTDEFALAPYAAWSEGLDRLRGRVSLRATATGPTDAPVIEIADLTARNFGARNINLARFNVAGLTLRPGTLNLGEVTVSDGSLQARLTGTMQTTGLSPAPRDDGRIDVRLTADVDRIEEFRDIVPAIGEVTGEAHVEFAVGGTPRALVTNGTLAVDLPTLEIVRRAEAATPFHNAALTSRMEDAADVVDEVLTPDTPPEQPVTVLYELVDNQIRLRVENNVILFDRFYFGAVPPEEGTRIDPTLVARRGEFEILENGRIVLPRTIDLRRAARGQNLLENPIELQIRARDFAGRTGPVAFQNLDLAVDVVPVFDGTILNQIVVREGHGWFNGGYLRLAGSVGLRSPNLGDWPDHLYDLTLRTPAVSPDTIAPPANAAAPVGREGGLVYPLAIRDRRVGEARILVDLGLVTREGQTPPLTLSGRVEVFDGEIREGILAAFALRGDGGEPVPWPASPLLDVTVVATENNWIRASVPSLQLPVRGIIRLSETPQRLKVAGTAELGQGQLDASFLKAPIDIRGGSGQFTLRRNPSTGAFEPYANFSAKAETVLSAPIGGGDYERYQVDLDVSGNAKPGTDKPVDTTFVVRAESNPPLAEEQIFAMLSRRAEFGQALESGELGSFLQGELANIALQTALSYALTPVFEELRRAFGLDVFTVRYELDRPLEIQASKYLVEHLYLTLIVEVGGEDGTKQTVKIDYEVAGGLRFGVQFDTESDYRLTGEYRTRF